YRNLHARVEAVCPIYDRAAREKLWSILQSYWNDTQQTWSMKTDASYEKKVKTHSPNIPGVQAELMKAALMHQNVTEDDILKEEKE
ncbi:MAG: polyphosphate kinase 1, partial [Bdellovibrionaceae bacterium]|nr:polyphosphate kinase 1 [Pseudobdellovibrionaceae bacterium]